MCQGVLGHHTSEVVQSLDANGSPLLCAVELVHESSDLVDPSVLRAVHHRGPVGQQRQNGVELQRKKNKDED